MRKRDGQTGKQTSKQSYSETLRHTKNQTTIKVHCGRKRERQPGKQNTF